MTRAMRGLFALLLGLLPLLSWAACSRPLNLPVSPIGRSLTPEGGKVSGAYASVLQDLGQRHGCEFRLSLVPRARAEQMFRRGESDLLMPATRTPERDAIAVFVPLHLARPVLVHLEDPSRGGFLPPVSLRALLETPGLRLALVRGADYGPEYRAMLRTLQQQRRVVLEPDAVRVMLALQAGLADATVLNATHVYGLSSQDARLRGVDEQLRATPLDGLDWGETGAYLSTRSLKADDRLRLQTLFSQAVSSGSVWNSLSQHYPPALLAASIKNR